MKTKMLVLFTLMALVNVQMSYADNNPLMPKKTAIVYPNAAHDALIVKSVKTQHLQLLNEDGEIIFEKTITRGTNSIKMRKLSLGRYKVVISENEIKEESTLVVR